MQGQVHITALSKRNVAQAPCATFCLNPQFYQQSFSAQRLTFGLTFPAASATIRFNTAIDVVLPFPWVAPCRSGKERIRPKCERRWDETFKSPEDGCDAATRASKHRPSDIFTSLGADGPGPADRCQGLHNGRFLPYGNYSPSIDNGFRVVVWTGFRLLNFQSVPPRREDECKDC
jgi:hypothetical protein